MVEPQTGPFARVLSGEPVAWRAFGLTERHFLDTCREEGLTGLVHHRVAGSGTGPDWPANVRKALADETRQRAATELLQQKEIAAIVETLATAGVPPLILKGTGLAHTHYPDPSCRPRIDTDLMISPDHVERVRRTLLGCGYTEPNFCGGDLFCQFPMRRTDRFGMLHKLDVHWKISTQPVFAEVLTFEEMAAGAVAVPALGPCAQTPGPVHALLLACVHPAMHHGNVESLLWLYDIHLLAQQLSHGDFQRFTILAISRRVAAICARQLETTRRHFRTPIPPDVLAGLRRARPEPSAAYLRSDRRWTDDLVSSMRALGRWDERARFLRGVFLPSPHYMRNAYALPRSPLAALLLPALYVHRVLAGGWKVLAGHK